MTNDMKLYLFTQFIFLSGLILTIHLGLLPALLAGLFVYFFVEYGTRHLARAGVVASTSKLLLLSTIAILLISGIALGVARSASYISEGPESFVVLLQRMADIVDAGKNYIPDWAMKYVPTNLEEWQQTTSSWLRENAGRFSLFGQDLALLLLHIIIGMVLGGLIAINPAFQGVNGPLAESFRNRVQILSRAFHRVVFSQVRISLLNTVLTGLFLVVILPLTFGPLPLTKTMIVVTLIAGLLPIIGNLISNTVIFLIALGVSPAAAISALIFLIVIHKLEYFFNAHIIGTQIHARAWEILIAMLVMDSMFGITGLIAAPIYYAYLKDELTEQKFI